MEVNYEEAKAHTTGRVITVGGPRYFPGSGSRATSHVLLKQLVRVYHPSPGIDVPWHFLLVSVDPIRSCVMKGSPRSSIGGESP